MLVIPRTLLRIWENLSSDPYFPFSTSHARPIIWNCFVASSIRSGFLSTHEHTHKHLSWMPLKRQFPVCLLYHINPRWNQVDRESIRCILLYTENLIAICGWIVSHLCDTEKNGSTLFSLPNTQLTGSLLVEMSADRKSKSVEAVTLIHQIRLWASSQPDKECIVTSEWCIDCDSILWLEWKRRGETLLRRRILCRSTIH